MKQNLSTAIDLYLQTQKTNPFTLHISGNSSSKQLVNLRNSAFILNKLSLLNLQHPQVNQPSRLFIQQVLQLYVTSIDSMINNPLMPYKDFSSISDLVKAIEHYYGLLQKLTFINQGPESAQNARKKASINSFWPRIRSLLTAIEDRIPNSHQYIREYVTIRRGLMEPDKKYFISQMMAKKVETAELQILIQNYQQGDYNFLTEQRESEEKPIIFQTNPNLSWSSVKRNVRMIPLSNHPADWKNLCQFLQSQSYKNLNQGQKNQILIYIKDVLSKNLEQNEHPSFCKQTILKQIKKINRQELQQDR